MNRARTIAAAALLFAFASAYAGERQVYVVETGKKYHTKNCRMKKGSKPMPISQAKKKGYTACKVCRPG